MFVRTVVRNGESNCRNTAKTQKRKSETQSKLQVSSLKVSSGKATGPRFHVKGVTEASRGVLGQPAPVAGPIFLGPLLEAVLVHHENRRLTLPQRVPPLFDVLVKRLVHRVTRPEDSYLRVLWRPKNNRFPCCSKSDSAATSARCFSSTLSPDAGSSSTLSPTTSAEKRVTVNTSG